MYSYKLHKEYIYIYIRIYTYIHISLMTQKRKNLPALQEIWVQSLG